MSGEILIREQYGASGKQKIYAKHSDQDSILELAREVKPRQAFREIITGFFREVFLPQGYPDSVSKDYLSYQFWDTVQAFCSTIMGTLTTHAIMKGVGVGDTAATPLAAAVTWIMKDGTGMVSRIMFAWWKGTCLDAECKKWRLVADGMNDVAMCLEMCLPLVKQYSTALLCFSTAMKAVVGVAGGATRAAITQHQAIRNNMGDVSAKDGSQETFVNLCASLAGICILFIVTEGMNAGLLFLFFAMSHLSANYMAVRALQMTNLNEERFLLLLRTYLLTEISSTPRIVKFHEAVILGTGMSAQKLCGHKIVMGASLAQVTKSNDIKASDIKFVMKQYQSKDYLHVEDMNTRTIYIILRKNITSISVLQAYFHAVLYGIAATILHEEALPLLEMKKSLYERSPVILGIRSALIQTRFLQYPPEASISVKAVLAANQVVNQNIKKFLTGIESNGWQTDTHLLFIDEWRGDW